MPPHWSNRHPPPLFTNLIVHTSSTFIEQTPPSVFEFNCSYVIHIHRTDLPSVFEFNCSYGIRIDQTDTPPHEFNSSYGIQTHWLVKTFSCNGLGQTQKPNPSFLLLDRKKRSFVSIKTCLPIDLTDAPSSVHEFNRSYVIHIQRTAPPPSVFEFNCSYVIRIDQTDTPPLSRI